MRTSAGKALAVVKKGFFLLLALGIGLLLIAVVNTALFSRSRQVVIPPGSPPPTALAPGLEEPAAAARLGRALQFKTISREGSPTQETELRGLHAYLSESFPKLHAKLKREVVSDFSLLYTWPGSDASLKPILLLAHMDVVPVETSTEASWQHPPFSGAIADGYIWGRGALDDKSAVLGILEAVELLVGAGYTPRRTIYLAFGHDEEAVGTGGAIHIAETLRSRGVRLEYVLDEGMAVTEGIMPMMKSQVALIGLAEKGYLSISLTVEGTGGHSSMPPAQTAAGILSTAVSRLEAKPFPSSLRGAGLKLFQYLGPELPAVPRLLFTNVWLFRPVIIRLLAGTPSTNAFLRTTTAATMLEGSPKDNVLPQRARAVFNFRLLPGDTVDQSIDRARQIVADPRVRIEAAPSAHEASPESSDTTPAYTAIARSIRETFPGALVVPSLVLGATDGRHFASVSDDVYRFAPHFLRSEDLDRLHGLNERIAVSNYTAAVRFYWQLIRNSDAPR